MLPLVCAYDNRLVTARADKDVGCQASCLIVARTSSAGAEGTRASASGARGG